MSCCCVVQNQQEKHIFIPDNLLFLFEPVTALLCTQILSSILLPIIHLYFPITLFKLVSVEGCHFLLDWQWIELSNSHMPPHVYYVDVVET